MVDIEIPEQLEPWLRQREYLATDESVSCTTLSGGVSNRVVRVQREQGPDWVIKQALPKLRVAVDWFSSPERIHREAAGLRALHNLLPAGSVPDFVAEDHQQHVLIMSAVPEPNENWKSMLLRHELQLSQVQDFARLLAELHAGAADHAELRQAFADTSFFVSLRLDPYYGYTASRVPEAAAFLTRLQQPPAPITLVHGDYSPKNILVHKQQLILLDHEVIHWGDPAFDVGFALTHLLSKAHYLRTLRDEFTSAAHEFWRVYSSGVGTVLGGAELAGRAAQHGLGCLLARAAGSSQLEYLSAGAKVAQTRAALACLAKLPRTPVELIDRFLATLNSQSAD